MPFVLPTVVVATAFLALLPDGVERTVWAILLAHVFFNVAVVVRVVGAFWAGLDPRLDDAAATLGASPYRRHRLVTAPLLAPAVASAASIVFLFCFTSFGVIVVLGGIRYATLEVEIYNQAARLFDLRAAAALALLQLGGGRRHGARLRQARTATRRRAVTPRACPASDRTRSRPRRARGRLLARAARASPARARRPLAPGRRRLRPRPLRLAPRRDARAAGRPVARDPQLAPVRGRRSRDRAHGRCPGGRGGGAGTAGARRDC